MATIHRRVQIPGVWEKAKGEAIIIPVSLTAYLIESEDTAGLITAITAADPGVITSTAHGRSDGDVVRLEDIEGMVELNGKRVTVASQATNTFELTTEETPAINIDTSDTTKYTAYTRAGRWRLMQSISSSTASHKPKDATGAAAGTVSTITVGTIANNTIPLTVPAFNADNTAGDNVFHEIHLTPTLANPTETPTFIISLLVLDDGT